MVRTNGGRSTSGAGPGPDIRPPTLRSIPSVESLLSSSQGRTLIEAHGREAVRNAIRTSLATFRDGSPSAPFDPDAFFSTIAGTMDHSDRVSIRRVINATGVLIHTNLGRSPLDPSAWSRTGDLVTGFCDLELDRSTGLRGHRDHHIEGLAQRLFGCDAAVLVNNNAAATLLLVAAVAGGREVVVSRGELVEIGGSFRVPEVITQGGATLREVGTTNRTRRNDYLKARNSSTAAFLRVHRSNFEIVGFTEQPPIADLVSAAREAGVPLLYDEGSGRAVDLAPYGLRPAPTIAELIAIGVDAVTFSTDKLLGASQGGLIVGRRSIVEQCRAHPLMRALRAGKESYAIVSESLLAFLRTKHEDCIPLYRMLGASLESLSERGASISEGLPARVIETRAVVGGGTTPSESMPSVALELEGDPNRLFEELLQSEPAVLARIEQDRLILDLRTVLPEEDAQLAAVLARATRQSGSK